MIRVCSLDSSLAMGSRYVISCWPSCMTLNLSEPALVEHCVAGVSDDSPTI